MIHLDERRALTRADLDPSNFGNVMLLMLDEWMVPVLTTTDAACFACEQPCGSAVIFRTPTGEPCATDPVCLACFPNVITEDVADGMVEVFVKVRA